MSERNWPQAIAIDHEAYVWFLTLMVEDSMNFHPDDSAESYVDETGGPTFSYAEAVHYNTLMGHAFKVCNDVYETAQKAQNAYNDALVFSARLSRDGRYMVLMRCADGSEIICDSHLPEAIAHRLALDLNEAAIRAMLASERQKALIARYGEEGYERRKEATRKRLEKLREEKGQTGERHDDSR